MKKYLPLFICLIFLLPAALFAQDNPAAVQETIEVAEANERVVLPVIEALGLLGPYAISPYLGLAITSGASLFFPNTGNAMLSTNPVLGNWFAFILFVVLALVTSFPNLFKSVKGLGLAVNYLEDKSAIVIVLLLQFIPVFLGFYDSNIQSQLGMGEEQSVAFSFGFLSFGIMGLVLIISLINLFIVMSVRFFFEVAAFITPIPFVDATLEVGKKLACGSLMIIYFISPFLAFLFSLLLFILALVVFLKSRNTMRYFKSVYLRPLFNKFTGRSGKFASIKLSGVDGSPVVSDCIPVFPMMQIGDVQYKEPAFLAKHKDKLYIVQKKALSKNRIASLNPSELSLGKDYGRILLFNAERSIKIVISGEYANKYEELLAITGAADAKLAGTKKTIQGSGFIKTIQNLFSAEDPFLGTEIAHK